MTHSTTPTPRPARGGGARRARRPGTAAPLALIAVGALLVGCGQIPDYRQGGHFVNPFSSRPSGPSTQPLNPVTPGAPASSVAESACREAGRAAGFEVRGVVGTQEVIGDDGQAQSRDVMLRVQRDGQTVDVRCSYGYADGTAQIMTL